MEELEKSLSCLRRLKELKSFGYELTTLNVVCAPSGKRYSRKTAENKLAEPLRLGNLEQAEALKSLEYLGAIEYVFFKSNPTLPSLPIFAEKSKQALLFDID